jgi:hypothetical protein
MFVDMVLMRVVQMTIVEVIDMVIVAHSRMSTARTMLMSVIGMMLVVAKGHGFAAYLSNCLVALNMQREFDTIVSLLRDTAAEQFGGRGRDHSSDPY